MQDQLIDELKELRRSFAELEVVQKSLTENESQYRQIIEKSNEAIFVVQDGRIHFANEKSSEIVGYSIEDILFSDAIATFVHPDDQEMVFQHHARRLQGDEEFYQYDFRIVHKDGIVRWLNVNPSLIMWEGKSAVLCLTTDITERKLAEDALLKSEQLLSSIFGSIPDGISVLDKDMNILTTNQTMERWYAHALPFTGKKCFEVYHGVSQPCRVCPAIQTLKTGKSFVEVVPMTGEGGIRIGWNELYSFPLTDAVTGEPSGVVEFVRDITKRKLLEAEKDNLIVELQNALSEVKKLSGFLPICASCKKIRNDKGYWQQVEEYISDHSQALFSHSICPDCMKRLYPEIADKVLDRQEKGEEK